MSYRLSANRALPTECQRALLAELHGARDQVRGVDGQHISEAIHEARKHLKKARALVRLLRPALGKRIYRRENADLRCAAQRLSPIRDAHVLEETLRRLLHGSNSAQARAALGRMHRTISVELANVLADSNTADLSKRVVADIERVAARVERASLRTVDRRSVRRGLERSYRRARRALTVAKADRTDENLHELRKRLKDVGYDLRLLRGDRGRTLKRLSDRVARLTDMLGDHHDLSMLENIPTASQAYTPTDRKLLDESTIPGKTKLRRDAQRLATQVLRRKSKDFSRRVMRHWKRS
jgi:CHAD domain-containing protein